MIVAIKRAKRFSPNSEDKDARILEYLCDLLRQSGFDIRIMDEDDFRLQTDADAYISMARSEKALVELSLSEVPVINTVKSVFEYCQNRGVQTVHLAACGFNVPEPKGNDGYWVKKDYGYS